MPSRHVELLTLVSRGKCTSTSLEQSLHKRLFLPDKKLKVRDGRKYSMQTEIKRELE